MKAVTVTPGSKGSVQLKEINQPKAKPNEALIRIHKLGIDGTDHDINAGFYGAPPDGEKFLIVGHEALGTIESVGEKVMGFSRGDLVVPTVRRGCLDSCLNCRNGESDMCLTGNYYEHGIYKLHGFGSEYGVSDANYLVKIPTGLEDVAVLLEPTSIVEKALYQVYHIQRRMLWEPKSALMLGAGPIGQLGTVLLRLRALDVDTVARRPKTDSKAQMVESTGANYVNARETLLDKLGKKYDIIIEGTGDASVAMDALRLLSPNGVLCFLGVYGPSSLTFEAGQLLREMVLRNKVAFGSVNANKKYFEMGLKDFQEIKKRYSGFLSKFFTLTLKPEEYMEAYEPRPSDIKTVIEFS
jgi:threonine dehydrogenase-like Zn-dependent dehydrogenase